MLVASSVPLGGFREDAVSVLGPILGTGRVTSFINGLEVEIRTQAEAGARQAIPDIKLAAKSAVMPYVIGAIVAGVVGGALGVYAIWKERGK